MILPHELERRARIKGSHLRFQVYRLVSVPNIILGAGLLPVRTISLRYWEHKEVASLCKALGLCNALAGRHARS